MLVCTRKVDESIMIGDNVKVTLIEIGKGRVRLGIEADKNIPIHRLEVYEKIKDGERCIVDG